MGDLTCGCDFPLWLGDMPAVRSKAFLEQTLRPGFAYNYRTERLSRNAPDGRAARTVVDHGHARSSVYRWYFRAHG